MRRAGIGLVRRALGDHGLAADERGTVLLAPGLADRAVHRFHIVPIDIRDDVPVIPGKALWHVVGVPMLDMALVGVDRDAVVVVQRDELPKAERAGKRARLVRDPFHHAAIAHEHVRVVIDYFETGTVEMRRQELLRESHADRVGDALPERPGGGLDARRAAVFRMSGRHRAELAETLQLLDRQRVAREVQQRVEQHRSVPVREHEPVAVRPRGVRRVVAQVPPPQRDRDLRHAHRHAGMPRLGRFHGIHGERADRVGEFGGRNGSSGAIHSRWCRRRAAAAGKGAIIQ